METMWESLKAATKFFMVNYNYSSLGLLCVKEDLIRFYAQESSIANKYKDALIINISPKRINILSGKRDVGEDTISHGFYTFHRIDESFGEWEKINADDNTANFIFQKFFGEEIKEMLKEINETSSTLYEEAFGIINPKMFSKNNRFFIEDTVTSYCPGNYQIIKDNHLPLFLKIDSDNKNKKVLPRTYVQTKSFLFLSEIFKDEIFINPDNPAAPVIFGKESILNPEPSALLFPPSWVEEFIVFKNSLKG